MMRAHRMRRAKWVGTAAAGVSAAMVFSGPIVVPAMATSAAAAADGSSVLPSCAWPIITNSESVNVAYPDTDSTYWTTPYRVEPDTKIVVNGTYVNSRFMSFNAYDSTFGSFSVNGVQGALIDYQIAPDAGSVNPWQQPTTAAARAATTGRKFTVTLQSDVPSQIPNTIPIAPTGTAAGSIGFLLMRVYLPKNGDYSAVKLPNISLVTSSGTTTIKPCAAKTQRAPTKANKNVPPAAKAALKQLIGKARDGGNPDTGSGPCTGSACPPDLQFSRAMAATTNSVFPNSASAYVSAIFQPNPKAVVLVRGLAPTTPALVPPGTEPLPWPSSRFQLQYFSMCNNIYRKPWPVIINNLPSGNQELGCRADNETKLDRQGRYTYVVASQAQKQAVSRWKKTTFLPTSIKSAKTREVLILRNMLSNDSFSQSAMNAPQDANAADAAASMGAYYPVAVSCALNFYLKHGPDACFKR